MADKTVIVTGASQGIGAGLANRFLERGYNVVATSRRVSQSAEVSASERSPRGWRHRRPTDGQGRR